MGWIAAGYGVTPQMLMQANGITLPNAVYPGQQMLAPSISPFGYRMSGAPPASFGSAPRSIFVYIVQRGDTLTRIAIRFHTSVIALVIANNIPNPNLIFAGMRLIIPGVTLNAPSPAPMPAPTMVPGMGMTYAVSLMGIAYNPNSLTVHAGAIIIWTNNESSAIPHTVTSGAPGAPSGTFDSPTLNPGQSFQFTFNTPGTITYFCRIHGAAMTGTVTVIP